MLHMSKLLVFLGSLALVLYGVSAAFYGKVAAKEDAYKELSVFIDVLDRVADDYVEVPSLDKVQEGAMRGLIAALDPYSSFLSREQYEEMQKRNGAAGAGMILSRRSDVVTVVSCERGGPAEQAGIRPGDYLISVDGELVEDKGIAVVESLLRGTPGAKLKVEIYRSSRSKPLQLDLTLDVPSPVTVTSSIEGSAGVLSVLSLNGTSVERIGTELEGLMARGVDRILLDLRNCADGGARAGADLANLFLPDGMIYYSRDRSGDKVDVVEADPERFVTGLPMAVLINGSTASAAEIAAGALKDRGRASVVGEKSFGVGSAQKTIHLRSGSVLVLSVAKFCTPGGKVIQDETGRNAGIVPDIQVPDAETRQDLTVESYYEDSEEAEKYLQLRQQIDRIQMERALDVLGREGVPASKAA